MPSSSLGRFAVNPLVTMQRMEGGAVLMDAASGECFELNRTGAEVWETIARGTAVDELVTKLAEQHAVAPERVQSDVGVLLTQMVARGLVRGDTR